MNAGLRGLVRELRDALGSTISFPADYFAGWFGVAPTESGVEVNELTAMQIAAFVGCVRIISGAIATLPFRVWQMMDDGTEQIAANHPLDNVLNNQPNSEVSAADFWQTVIVHILLTGNSYAEVAYNNAGQAAGLYLRSPFRTMPYRRTDGALAYKTNDTSKASQYERWIEAADMVHVKGLGMDSLVGLSPVKYYAREVLGNDLAAQSYSSKFFANDSRPGGYLTAPGVMGNDKKKQAVESWIAAHSRGNVHAMALLDAGVKWEKVGVNPDEAQFILTRKLNREQIACIFGVPVHFLGESVESRANMEQRAVEFLQFTLKPYLAKIEQAVNMRMFPKVGRGAGRFHARMDVTMFERATYADLLRGIQMGRYAGLYTVNEGRKLLGEQPYSDAQLKSDDPGDKLWQPVNMVVVTPESVSGELPATDKGDGQGGNDQGGGDGSGKPASPTTQGGKREIQHYFRLFYPTFKDAFGRLSARKKVDEGDWQKALGPVLVQIASAFSFSLEAEDVILSAASAQFVRDYISGLSRRIALNGNVEEVVKEELRKVIRALREKCQPVLPVAPAEEEEEGEVSL